MKDEIQFSLRPMLITNPFYTGSLWPLEKIKWSVAWLGAKIWGKKNVFWFSSPTHHWGWRLTNQQNSSHDVTCLCQRKSKFYLPFHSYRMNRTWYSALLISWTCERAPTLSCPPNQRDYLLNRFWVGCWKTVIRALLPWRASSHSQTSSYLIAECDCIICERWRIFNV